MKAQACGNDFLIVEEGALADAGWKGRHAALARWLCARTTGIGADGVEFLDRRADGTLFLRLFNADGSEAELSGNGTRCVAAALFAEEPRQEVVLGTHGGPRRCRLQRQEGAAWWIETGMGVPRVMRRAVEIDGIEGPIEGAMVNVGNPHFVLFPERDDFGAHGLSWQELGGRLSVDPVFRFGTNVEFVRIANPGEVAFRIVERGVGPTSSSGTGTCASAAAAMVLHGAARTLTATSPGGAQTVHWPGDREELLLTGPAELICTGEALIG